MREGFIRKFCLFGGGLYLLTAIIWALWPESEAATITTGYTFSSGETNITHTKLNQSVNSATLSGVTTADINDSAITGAKIAANTIPGSKIQTNAISGGLFGQIATNTITTSNIVIGTLTGREFATTTEWPSASTINFTNNVVVGFTNNQIAANYVVGITNSAGSSSSNSLVKTYVNGKVSRSLMGLESGSAILTTNILAGLTYTTLCSFTPTETNGTIIIWGYGQYRNASATDPVGFGIDLHDGSSALVATTADPEGTNLNDDQLGLVYTETLANPAKTYSLRGIIGQATATGVYAGGSTNTAPDDTDIKMINPTRLQYLVIPSQ